jgi:hypothetical protein
VPSCRVDPVSARRILQLALAAAWLVDAALQFQPFMFGRGFATTVIVPAAQGNPPPVAHSMLWGAHVMLAEPVLWNGLFATTQLALALGLCLRRTVKLALAASVAWALGIWWFGEGLGGVLAGTANPLTGAPGPVILYALLALLAWPSTRSGRSLASSSVLGSRGALAAWVSLWGSELYLALQRGHDSASALRVTFTGLADGEPGSLARLDRWAAGGSASHGTVIALALATVLALTLVAAFLPARVARPLLGLALLLTGAIWVVAQNFGGILTGQATDPNSGPLLMLVVLAYWPFWAASYARAGRPWPLSAAAQAPSKVQTF